MAIFRQLMGPQSIGSGKRFQRPCLRLQGAVAAFGGLNPGLGAGHSPFLALRPNHHHPPANPSFWSVSWGPWPVFCTPNKFVAAARLICP